MVLELCLVPRMSAILVWRHIACLESGETGFRDITRCALHSMQALVTAGITKQIATFRRGRIS